jgi:hypothetical protein
MPSICLKVIIKGFDIREYKIIADIMFLTTFKMTEGN